MALASPWTLLAPWAKWLLWPVVSGYGPRVWSWPPAPRAKRLPWHGQLMMSLIEIDPNMKYTHMCVTATPNLKPAGGLEGGVRVKVVQDCARYQEA